MLKLPTKPFRKIDGARTGNTDKFLIICIAVGAGFLLLWLTMVMVV